MVAGVRMRHEGTFDMGEGSKDNWMPFTSEQVVVTRGPGFDWNGRVAMMPGLPVRVHDAYVAGEGVLHASLLRRLMGMVWRNYFDPPSAAPLPDEGWLIRRPSQAHARDARGGDRGRCLRLARGAPSSRHGGPGAVRE
jgi:hypothetical protein